MFPVVQRNPPFPSSFSFSLFSRYPTSFSETEISFLLQRYSNSFETKNHPYVIRGRVRRLLRRFRLLMYLSTIRRRSL
jgi:hypothetical protein